MSSLPPRQRSQRLVDRKTQQERELLRSSEYTDQSSVDARGAPRARKPLANHNNNTQGAHLYPGLNDITDVFEAIPLDLIRYFTLLKEIDAKCVATTPLIKPLVTRFLALSHAPHAYTNPATQRKRHELLAQLKALIKDLLPCLEEKMHVASVASDLMHKYARRMNDDYELILSSEVPESVRIGPLQHPAMINLDGHKSVAEKTAHTQRSESRREALAAKKAAQGDEEESPSASVAPTTAVAPAKTGKPRKDKQSKESTPVAVAATKKRRVDADDGSRSSTPAPSSNGAKKRQTAKKKETGADYTANPAEGDEPVYCYCQQVSYGEMVGCDGEQCTREWFHLSCLGFDTPPKGKWYCDDCKRENMSKRRK